MDLPVRAIEDLRFVVVGAYVLDCFVNTPRLPAWGQTVEARSIRTTPGGKALNQAVALARLGAQVAAVGVVGADGPGRDILATLSRERVDVSWVEARADVATTICLCFVSDEGDSAIMWHIDDDVAVRPETVCAAESAFDGADATLLTFELPPSAIRETISVARRGGGLAFVQPAPVLAGSADALSLPWDQVDVLVPNETEARALLKDGERLAVEDLGQALADELGVPRVVVTLGPSGCLAHLNGATYPFPAQETKAVDTTGASDAFVATLAAQFTAGVAAADAIQAAQSAAARSIRRAGSHKSMPYANGSSPR